MTKRVVVFIDYENMHRCASSAFNVPSGHFSPWAIGQRIVRIRNAYEANDASALHQVRVYRGLPDSRKQPKANAKNQAQKAAWEREAPRGGLHVYHRPLRYPPRWPKGEGAPQEKGVDVALAVDLVQMAFRGDFDVAVVCSHDTDLSPALDVVATSGLTDRQLEVASWSRKRIWYSADHTKPWCHRLTRADFDSIQERPPT